MKILYSLAWLIILFYGAEGLCSQYQFDYFTRSDQLSLQTLDFQNYLHFGSYRSYSSAIAHLGYDFNLFSVTTPGAQLFSLGVNASVHLYMFPENRTFYVDNFYATLGIFVEAGHSEKFFWRLYPFYHLSAHLADGYMKNGANPFSDNLTGSIQHDKKTISNEMLYASVSYKPMPFAEINGGAGCYYHACASGQPDLKGRCDVSLFLVSPMPFIIQPLLLLKNELIFDKEPMYGITIAGGILAGNKQKNGMGIDFCFFYKPHPGQYWGMYEKGYGIDIRFIF
jgi:hypothetical protein